jgi:hypothetical protein
MDATANLLVSKMTGVTPFFLASSSPWSSPAPILATNSALAAAVRCASRVAARISASVFLKAIAHAQHRFAAVGECGRDDDLAAGTPIAMRLHYWNPSADLCVFCVRCRIRPLAR